MLKRLSAALSFTVDGVGTLEIRVGAIRVDVIRGTSPEVRLYR